MMKYKSVYLKKGKEESLKRFHPWIFSGAIDHADEIEEGETVRVFTKNGKTLVIHYHGVSEVPKGTAAAILKQAGIK